MNTSWWRYHNICHNLILIFIFTLNITKSKDLCSRCYAKKQMWRIQSVLWSDPTSDQSKTPWFPDTLCRISGLDRKLQQKRQLPANTKPAAEDLRGKSADGCAWLSPSFHRSWICLVQQASRRCSAGGQLSINYYIYSMMTCQITAFWFSERGNRDFIRAKR